MVGESSGVRGLIGKASGSRAMQGRVGKVLKYKTNNMYANMGIAAGGALAGEATRGLYRHHKNNQQEY